MKAVNLTPIAFTLRSSGNTLTPKRPTNRDNPRAAPH